jgi:hypothetical protein
VISKSFGIHGVPTIIIVDRNYIVRHRDGIPDDIDEAIRSLPRDACREINSVNILTINCKQCCGSLLHAVSSQTVIGLDYRH